MSTARVLCVLDDADSSLVSDVGVVGIHRSSSGFQAMPGNGYWYMVCCFAPIVAFRRIRNCTVLP